MLGESFLKRLVEKAAEKLDVQKSAGFPWSKGIPDRNFPRPMTGGSGCLAPAILIILVPLVLLAIALF
ncbi:MAG TPA: hypothetical protein PLP83_11100 [Candidatus Aminicenantes bacterium]|nr:hypothetical protein [Candidatus Aminicenantes bacterium]